MIDIKHLATTELQNDTSRLTFEIECKRGSNFKCELVIELRWFWSLLQEISVGNYHLQKDIFKETFHIDVPNKIAKKWSRFRWEFIGFIAFNGSYSRIQGKGKRKIENNIFPFFLTKK